MNVGQLAATTPRPPLRGKHHQVERVHRLDLQPGCSATAGEVGRGGRLRHDALVTGGQRRVQELRGSRGVGRDQPVDAPGGRDQRVQGGQSVGGRGVEQIHAVAVQDIEEKHRKWLCSKGRRYIDRPPES